MSAYSGQRRCSLILVLVESIIPSVTPEHNPGHGHQIVADMGFRSQQNTSVIVNIIYWGASPERRHLGLCYTTHTFHQALDEIISQRIALKPRLFIHSYNKAIRDGRPRPPHHQGFIAISYGGSELRHRSILETITHRPKCQIQVVGIIFPYILTPIPNLYDHSFPRYGQITFLTFRRPTTLTFDLKFCENTDKQTNTHTNKQTHKQTNRHGH